MYLFNGSTDGFQLPTLTGLNDYSILLRFRVVTEPGTSNACVIAWDEFPTTPRDAVLALHDRSSNVAGLFASVAGTGASDYNSPNVPLLEDVTLAIRRQGDTVELYYNGVLKSTVTVGAGATTLANGRLACHYFSGSNSEFSNIVAGQLAVYTSYLDDNDIAEHALGATPHVISPGTRLHYYPMEADLADVDGNGADLTAVGSPTWYAENTEAEGAVYSTYWESSKMIARASDGRLWVCFIESTRYVQVRYSDDDGLTWSSAINAIDLGNPSAEDPWIQMGLDDRPLVFCFDQGGTGDPIHVARYDGDGLGTFSATSFTTATSGNMQRLHKCSCVTSTGRWYIFYPQGTTSQSFLSMRYSDDDGATWSAATTVWTGESIGPGFNASRGSTIDVICGPDDVIHIALGDPSSTGTTGNAMHYLYADVSGGAPGSLTAELVHNPGFGIENDNFDQYPSIALDRQGDVYIAYQAPSQDNVAADSYQVWFCKRTAGTWGTPVEVAAGTAAEGAGTMANPTMWVPEDGRPRIIGGPRGLGTNTADRNPVYWEATDSTGATWKTPQKLIDVAREYYHYAVPAQYTKGLGHTQLRSGYLIVANDFSNQDVETFRALPAWYDSFYTVTTLPPTTPVPTTVQPSGVLGGNITYGYFSSASGNASAGDVAWTTPEAAGEPDEGSYATVALNGQESQYLLITNPALGPFSIPAGAQITGIEIHVEAFATSVDPICIEAAIVKGGAISATNVANSEIVGIYEYRGLYYGGQGEVFGESWSSTDFGSGFGIALRVSSPNAQTISVDSAKVIIYWQKTPAATLSLVHAATPMAPCSIHADVLQSYIGGSSWEKVGVNWEITGPVGWEMLSTDPRPGAWGVNRARDCSTDMWGYSAAIFADVAGDYTIEATIYLEDGSTLVVSDVVTVAADTRAVRYLKDDGSDLADGTSLANAWATWEHAISQLTSNMRLVVQDDDSWLTTGSPSTNRSISSVDNVVIERSGDGLAKPVIEMTDSNAVFHISDLSDLIINGIEILGNSDHTSPGDRITSNLVTSRITFANCDSSQGHNSWWESVGASGRTHVLIYNCLIEDVNRYGFYAAGSQGDRNHILIGTEFKSSSLRPPTGEGLVRFAGSGTSSTLGYGFNVLWCKFDANGQNHAGARSSANWSHIFQCDFGDSVLGISETADDIKLRLLYVKRYDGIYLNADNQTAPVTTPERNSLIYFCNSVIILGAPPGVGFSNPVKNGHYRYTTYAQNTFLLTFDSTGSQNAFKNTVGAANKATFAGIRIKGIVFAIVSPGATVNAYFMRDEVASPYSILDGGGSISECVTAKISLGDGRYIIRGTAYNTSAGANSEPGVDGLGISQADLDSEDLAVSHLNVSSRNFLPPSGQFTDFETWCTPEPGVWVDYRGVLRDQGAVTWPVGATGLEDAGATSAPNTTLPPPTLPPTTAAPTLPPTTLPPTTVGPTPPPTTVGPTPPPTTAAPTLPPTTPAPTTAPVTVTPITPAPPGAILRPNVSPSYEPVNDLLHVRAWVEDEWANTVNAVIGYKRSSLEIIDEEGRRIDYAQGEADGAGPEYVRFRLTGLQLSGDHNYLLRVKIAMPTAGEVATGTFPMPTEG